MARASLHNAGVTKPILSFVTQTIVDRSDPAFAQPTKYIRSGYSHSQAEKLAGERGWAIAADGPTWRRVVASPEPQRLVEQASITDLLGCGTVVVRGGAPVYEDVHGQLTCVAALGCSLVALRTQNNRIDRQLPGCSH